MAEKLLASDDPYAIIAQRAPGRPGTDPDAAMARVFIEEYALLGFTPTKILRLFQAARFEGTRRILEARGEDFVRRLINEVFGTTPRAEGPSRSAGNAPEGGALPENPSASVVSTPQSSGGN
ncbi:MAG: hypothetical protein ACE5EF_08595 [Dehalococcoidia bacterium]